MSSSLTVIQLAHLINVLGGAQLLVISGVVWWRYPHPFFRSWVAGFCMFMLLITTELVGGHVGRGLPLAALEFAAGGAASWCFLVTGRRIREMARPGPRVLLAVLVATGASLGLLAAGVPFGVSGVPMMALMTGSLAWMGWVFLRALPHVDQSAGARWVGISAILLASWPFLFPFPLFIDTPWAPLGYIGSGLFELSLGFGMIVYVLDLSWTRFRRSQEEHARTKNAFVSMVSHELRSPLTAAIGYAEFLEEELAGPLNEEQRGYVAEIQKGHRRLRRLVDDLLDFSLAEGRELKLDVRDGELGALVGSAVESMRLQAQQAGVSLTLAPADGPLPMRLDAERLEQVVANLVGNALKFTPEGGAVRVTLERAGAEARLVVHDSGMGIETADLPRLFEMFFQAQGGSRRGRGGAGLGLAVAKAIVEAHGGSIAVDSQIGQGTRFEIRMPLAERVFGEDLREAVTS